MSEGESSCIWLRIIQVNDVYELDNFASLKTLIDEHAQQENGGPDTTLVVLAGDFLAPSLLSSLDKGRGMVDILNLCGFTHVCIGNHETDIPLDALSERIRQSDFCWLNTNMRELDDKLGVKTAVDDIVEVVHGDQSKRVGLLGLLTDDPSLYRAGAFADAKIEPVMDATERHLQEAPADIDLWIPLTHQRMPEDRNFANKFTGSVFPVVIGGHDHEPYDETHSDCRIIKTGYDAINTAVIDIKWPIHDGNSVSERPSVEVKMIPTNTYAPNPQVQARVACHQRVLEELERAKLFRFEDWMDDEDNDIPFSTTDNRIKPSNGSSVLVSTISMGMRAECGLLNAGGIRGNRVYDDQDAKWFTWSDLKAEIPYPTEMVTAYVPGRVLEETIAYSRRGARETPVVARGGYIQTSHNIRFNDETQTIESIGGKPFDPEKLYLTALPAKFFMGIDNHVPLLEWAKGKPELAFDEECGIPAKVVLVELFSAVLWLNVGSFDDIDLDRDGRLSREEVKKRATLVFGDEIAELVVDNVMSVADIDSTGYISPLEMMVVQFVATDMLDHVCTQEELSVMRKVVCEVLGTSPSHEDTKRVVQELHEMLDLTGDGKIKREEAMKALGEIKRKNLLE